jgi:hypothetical protein
MSVRTGFLAVVLPIFSAVAAPAQAQNMSSYQDSCRHVRVEGATLFADCRRRDGSFNDTSIAIPGIANIDGNFQFQGMGQASSYQMSCRHIRVTGSTLSAKCRRMDGSWDETSILIPGIANIDGNLQYQ